MSEQYGHTPSSTEDWSDCEPQPYVDTPLPYVQWPSRSPHVEQLSPSIQQSAPRAEEAQHATAYQLGNGLMGGRTLLSEDSEQRSVPRIHWTALVSCGVSIWATLAFLLPIFPFGFYSQLIDFLLRYSQLIDFLPRSSLSNIFSALVFYLFPLIFAGMALALSFKPHWRKGRGIAMVGVLLPLLILMLYGAFVVYVVEGGP